MRKEVKYRAWLKADKLMINVNQLHWHQDGLYVSGNLMTDNDGLHYYEGLDPDEVVLMEYVGLQDKNNTPIYEYDTIRIHEGMDDFKEAMIIWDENLARYVPNNDELRFEIEQAYEYYYEVVGNKFTSKGN